MELGDGKEGACVLHVLEDNLQTCAKYFPRQLYFWGQKTSLHSQITHFSSDPKLSNTIPVCVDARVFPPLFSVRARLFLQIGVTLLRLGGGGGGQIDVDS